MLRSFSYLDTTTLNQYVSALENGLVSEETRRTMNSSKSGAGVNVKVAHADAGKAAERESEQRLSDNSFARFERLLRAAQMEPEELDWNEITQPDVDFPALGLGSIVSWECELAVPESLRMMSKTGEMASALAAVSTLLPSAKALGLDVGSLPDDAKLGAMADMISGMDVKPVVVGGESGTRWKVFATLRDEHQISEVEGYQRVVGKVTRIVPAGQRHQILKMSGAPLANRSDRRAQQKQSAGVPDDHYVIGPALEISLLAAYI